MKFLIHDGRERCVPRERAKMQKYKMRCTLSLSLSLASSSRRTKQSALWCNKLSHTWGENFARLMKTRAQEMLLPPPSAVCHLYSGNFVNYMRRRAELRRDAERDGAECVMDPNFNYKVLLQLSRRACNEQLFTHRLSRRGEDVATSFLLTQTTVFRLREKTFWIFFAAYIMEKGGCVFYL